MPKVFTIVELVWVSGRLVAVCRLELWLQRLLDRGKQRRREGVSGGDSAGAHVSVSESVRVSEYLHTHIHTYTLHTHREGANGKPEREVVEGPAAAVEEVVLQIAAAVAAVEAVVEVDETAGAVVVAAAGAAAASCEAVVGLGSWHPHRCCR